MGRKKSKELIVDQIDEVESTEVNGRMHTNETPNAPDIPECIPPPSYLVERAKSGRADCKKCGEKINNKELRIGVIMDGEWGLFTRWQHLNCTVFHKQLASVESIDGYKQLTTEEKDIVSIRFQKSKGERDDEFDPIDPDEIVRKTWNESMEPPDDLLMPLLPYQKEGLAWMYHQEQSSVHGGILADEMGMGKTIQAISIVLQNRPLQGNKAQDEIWKQSDIAHEWKGKFSERGNTLIVVPTVAIRQWQMEIARFTREGSLTVKVYHGTDRSTTLNDILSYDVIITSYKILEIEYRKATAGTKVECRICGKKFYPEKLRVHRKYFCGETAQRTEAQARTEKKKTSGIQEKMKIRDLLDSDDSDKDSVTQQKLKLKIKLVKTDKSSKIQKNATKKEKELYFSEVSSDDEVTKQKKFIKATLNGHSKKGESSKMKQTNSKSKNRQLTTEKIEDPSSSSDDGKFGNRSRKRQLKKDKSVPIAKRVKREPKTNKTNNFQKESVDSDLDDDSEYADENESSSSSSDDDEEERGKHPLKSTKSKRGKANVRVNGKGRGNIKNGKSKKKRAKTDFDSDLDSGDLKEKSEEEEDNINEDEDEAMAEVERDIQEALLRHAKEMKKSKAATQSLLHLVSWFRVILDEAHLIKDRSTSTAKAVFNLTSVNKWCLTGTPLQNRVSELYSLVRFLRIDPFAYYFCRSKDCDCKSLHYRFTNSRCDDCGHSVISHYCQFNRVILNPIQRSGFIADGRKAMLILKQQVLDEILLRRTKTTRADDICLPTRIVKLRQDQLDEKEEDFYQALYTKSKAQFNTYLHSGTVLNNYAHIFDILIRLRQAVDHPYLVIYSESQQHNDTSNHNTRMQQGNYLRNDSPTDWSKEECNLCREPVEANDPVQSSCGHVFCHACITDYIETMKGEGNSPAITCPTCHEPLTLIFDAATRVNTAATTMTSNSVWNPNKRRKKSILDKIDLSLFQTSTKMEALMEELYLMNQRDPGSKAIVFSQFVNMLDLLEYRIEKGGIRCVKLQGSMNVEQRDKAVNQFKNDPEVKVLLISLKAGGVALNLTVANYIFLMDPWWNPAAEMQAIDRTHRIGQYKPIYATRFIIENSIEERIIKLQEKKKLVFDGTVGYDQSSMTKLTVEDMRFLFQ